MRRKCVACGKETLGIVCADCSHSVLEDAVRERIPLVGHKPEARRIGFDPRRNSEPGSDQ